MAPVSGLGDSVFSRVWSHWPIARRYTLSPSVQWVTFPVSDILSAVGPLPPNIHPPRVLAEAGLVTVTDVHHGAWGILVGASLDCLRPYPRDISPAVFKAFLRLAFGGSARSSLLAFSSTSLPRGICPRPWHSPTIPAALGGLCP